MQHNRSQSADNSESPNVFRLPDSLNELRAWYEAHPEQKPQCLSPDRNLLALWLRYHAPWCLSLRVTLNTARYELVPYGREYVVQLPDWLIELDQRFAALFYRGADLEARPAGYSPPREEIMSIFTETGQA